jgi:hypothetical protein
MVWLFIVPAWLILGVLTAGWFWPPQLREGLFKQKIYIREEPPDVERYELLAAAGKDISNLKDDIVKQFVRDRKVMKSMREQTKNRRKEILEELKNMKGVMSSLYEVQQQIIS